MGVVQAEFMQAGGAVEEGNTIIEEDASILADLDSAFVAMQEDVELLRMYGVEEGDVDYRCVSDGGTEVDSEFDKIEYEFQPVRGDVSDEEMDFEVEKLDEIVDDQMKEMLYSVLENETMREESANADGGEIGAEKGDSTDYGVVPQSNVPKRYEFDIFPPHQSVDTSTCALEDSSSSPVQQSQRSTSDTTPEEIFHMHSDTLEALASSSSFSNIIFGVSLNDSNKGVGGKEKKDGKEDLRDFLLKSGLFAEKK